MLVQHLANVLIFLKYAMVNMIVLFEMMKKIVLWICQKLLHVKINQCIFQKTDSAIVSGLVKTRVVKPYKWFCVAFTCSQKVVFFRKGTLR